MSCWVRRHFINSVKLCLWLILHFLELLVNSAKFFLSFSSKHGVCLSQWGLISHRAGSDIRSQVESQIQVNEWGLNTVIGSQQMVMPVLNRSRVCVNDPPGVKCTLALYSCTMIVHLVQESQKPFLLHLFLVCWAAVMMNSWLQHTCYHLYSSAATETLSENQHERNDSVMLSNCPQGGAITLHVHIV